MSLACEFCLKAIMPRERLPARSATYSKKRGCLYFLCVPVSWLHQVPETQAVNEVGLFGNQNSVARPRSPKWEHTVKRLKEVWRSQLESDRGTLCSGCWTDRLISPPFVYT